MESEEGKIEVEAEVKPEEIQSESIDPPAVLIPEEEKEIPAQSDIVTDPEKAIPQETKDPAVIESNSSEIPQENKDPEAIEINPSEFPQENKDLDPETTEKPRHESLNSLSKIQIERPVHNDSQDCESPRSPKVFVSLRSPEKETIKKSGLILDIADSLNERNQIKEAKLSNLRVKQKADEIGKLRNVPEINHKSKKITEQKSEYKKANSIQKKNSPERVNESSSSSELFVESPIPTNNLSQKTKKKVSNTNVELLKTAMKLREPVNAPQAKPKTNLNLTQRAKLTNDKKNKIREVEIKKRQEEELNECTFKPKLCPKNQVSDSGSFIIKRSQSGKLGDESMIRKNLVNSPTSMLNVTRLMFEENFKLTSVALSPVTYSQISPVQFAVKHKHGYDEKTIRAKAHPMVDYKTIGNSLD